MDNLNIGKNLIFAGSILIILGIFFIFFNKIHIGNIPGDIHIKKENYTIDFPIMTSIIISIVITILINLYIKLFKGH